MTWRWAVGGGDLALGDCLEDVTGEAASYSYSQILVASKSIEKNC
jgi:hypothetical protein